ncbi:hypothetical protein [Altererythrobacter litoralis]|uniref:Uncharacterized protein n=1 Tax=Altererythrobacter litoralis TaxID=3113904 RepID=A0ABU7GFH2_9SPHN|nr:hypothetical protein [Erythrobacteraceae bacterium 1XM1-14]
MGRESSLPQRVLLDSLIAESHAFNGQEIHADIGPGIARKRPAFRIIFPIVRLASRSRLANMLMVAAVVLGYRVIREPNGDAEVFQYGVSDNNVSAFTRLNECLDLRTRSAICMNGRPIPLGARLKIAISITPLRSAGGALRAQRHPDPLVHLQSVLAVAASVIFSVRPLSGNLKVVCIACDHSPIVMALLAAARQQGKRTCYVQHAPVTEHFPPLTYDLSILHDRASVEAYRKVSKRLNVPFNDDAVTILPPFAEAFRAPQVDPPPYRIGICLSFLPDKPRIKELVASLSARRDVAGIHLRRHPRCSHDWSAIAGMPKVYLRSQQEVGVDFFAAVDIVLVPNSGVAIEALHFGKPTFFTTGADAFRDDYYGFVVGGILPVFSAESLNAPTDFFDGGWKGRFLYHDETMIADVYALQEKVQMSFMKIYWEARKARNPVCPQ